MLPAMLVTQTRGQPDRAAREIPLGELLHHPALSGLRPGDRDALHLAADQLERLADDGIAVRVRIAHVGDLVPISLFDARAAVYCTTGSTREVHVWVNGDDVTGKSGASTPVLLQVLAGAAGAHAPALFWADVDLPLAGAINGPLYPLDGEATSMLKQAALGESVQTKA
ncbi:hypothetical protein HLB44_16865 [Aquincola sp. S2]|uniref:Uncharacterized protein n=1 Tax=Pseudaquabacterium terrae TaxID=2732868 RepID=A0ABX2EJB2_9BURK|nr:hypothetical protein [Aquabacterium terrae]NRF68666.1 hypothetical protein [Aquabacterium terrae]